jgi:ribosomal protein S18 acetylase RimI-like enzyme
MAIWIERFKDIAGTLTLVAERNGNLIGFAHSVIDEDTEFGTLLDNLHVSPSHKRRGLGTRLMLETALRLKVQASSTALYLSVLADNEQAQRFYEAIGGIVAGGSLSEHVGGEGLPTIRYIWPNLDRLVELLGRTHR